MTDDLGRFRVPGSIGTNKDIILSPTNKNSFEPWKSIHQSHITTQEWGNYTFLDAEEFMVAFKDVQGK